MGQTDKTVVDRQESGRHKGTEGADKGTDKREADKEMDKRGADRKEMQINKRGQKNKRQVEKQVLGNTFIFQNQPIMLFIELQLQRMLMKNMLQ